MEEGLRVPQGRRYVPREEDRVAPHPISSIASSSPFRLSAIRRPRGVDDVSRPMLTSAAFTNVLGPVVQDDGLEPDQVGELLHDLGGCHQFEEAGPRAMLDDEGARWGAPRGWPPLLIRPS